MAIIYNDAFYGRRGLTSVTISGSVTSIADRAFSHSSGLTGITMQNSVTSTGEGSFYGCSSLINITISYNVTSIENWAFYGCNRLSSVTFKNTSGWGVYNSSTATSGNSVTETDTSQNATYLKSTYYNYYWEKT